MRMKTVAAAMLALTTAVGLTGCGSSGSGDSGGDALSIVASTNVYGDIAQQIAGDKATVTSIIDDPNRDPHDYEATTSDQLTLSKAAIVVLNGGGYDSFITKMLKASDSKPAVIDAVAVSGLPGSEEASKADGDSDESAASSAEPAQAASSADDHDHSHEAGDDHDHSNESGDDDRSGHDHGEFNEHVWYSVPTMIKVTQAITEELKKQKPADAQTFTDNSAKLVKELDGLKASIDEVKKTSAGKKTESSEPVPLWLFHDMGLEDVTPEEFLEAVEEGNDVPPIVMKKALEPVKAKQIAVLGYNEQAANDQTAQLKDEATKAGVPVVDLNETMPKDSHYVDWMGKNISQVADAVKK